MDVVIVGSSEPVGALAAALAEHGVEAEAHRLGGAGGPSAEALAADLVELERLVANLRPTAIISLGPGDAATAAALVAGKSGVRHFSLLDARAGMEDEARAVAELSAATFPFPKDGPAVARTAAQIADALSDG